MDKKQRFVIISDVHGFYDEMIDALNKVNFNPETDFLISLGDHTDRGNNPRGVIDYLKSLPNKKLIKGNHSNLLMDCIERQFPYDHDWLNCTAQTILDLAPNAKTFQNACAVAYDIVKPFVNGMVNYFETKNYVFVHSWIPVNCNDGLPAYYKRHRKFSKKDDWRMAHQSEWNDAMWMNPLEMAINGFGIEKPIVCGHWHCSAGWAMQNGTSEFGDNAIFEPFYYEDKLIMIDACTAYSGKCNVLVIEDEFLED